MKVSDSYRMIHGMNNRMKTEIRSRMSGARSSFAGSAISGFGRTPNRSSRSCRSNPYTRATHPMITVGVMSQMPLADPNTAEIPKQIIQNPI